MRKMNDICIFTPTYNRAYRLGNLFESLKRQDSGEAFVRFAGVQLYVRLHGEKLVQIPCQREFSRRDLFNAGGAHGGKARAHNTGVEHCDSELFFCVDSDDELTPHALKNVWSRWLEVRNNPGVAGIIGVYGKTSDEPLGTWMPDGVEFSTMWDLYYKLKYKGDSAHIYRTDILRRFPFKVAEGEKFIAETYVYHQIDQEYTLATLIVVAESLPDGYSKNFPKLTRENPVGYHTLKRLYINYADDFFLKYESSILYMVGHMLANTTKEGIDDAPHKPLALLACPPAWLLCKTVFK